jgi:hypothetical protein
VLLLLDLQRGGAVAEPGAHGTRRSTWQLHLLRFTHPDSLRATSSRQARCTRRSTRPRSPTCCSRPPPPRRTGPPTLTPPRPRRCRRASRSSARSRSPATASRRSSAKASAATPRPPRRRYPTRRSAAPVRGAPPPFHACPVGDVAIAVGSRHKNM